MTMIYCITSLFVFVTFAQARKQCPSGAPAIIECVSNPFVPGTHICPGAHQMSCPEIQGKHYCCSENNPPNPRPPVFSLPDPNACADLAANCRDYVHMCHSPGHIAVMKETCRLTCKFCAGSPQMMMDEPECADTTEKCEEWKKQGFCEKEGVKPETKKLYCAKTCEMC
ncbi:hypothetical protein L596_022970 [Steinernema carpocapsae]|uniref:ShKT domain-containing protein n=1 Tax=Steinernema carpocapsae TaxID=34508 RepID=A0A4U5MC67_STECR|nr:hypothetical protein L596_022970 [Steinernema carpocapsae]